MRAGFSDFYGAFKNRLSGIGQRPTFFLTYLIFYFAPWLFVPPSGKDIVLTIGIFAIFIPLHYRAFERQDRGNLVLIALMEGVTFLAAPLNGNNGVFHIFASAHIAYQKQAAFSAALFIGATALYAAISYLFDRSLFEIGFVCFMGVMIWGSCLADAERTRRSESLIREHELEKQQSSIVERERIARDLHDLLGHTLTMVALKSDLAARLIDADPERAKQEIIDIQKSSRNALTDVRAIVRGMLTTTIADELENAKTALSAAGIALTISGALPRHNVENETVTALSIREAVTNIIRHSGADSAKIHFTSNETEFFLHIEDNGKGSVQTEGSGLAGLRARVEKLGGQAIIDGVNGVRIAIVLPRLAGET